MLQGLIYWNFPEPCIYIDWRFMKNYVNALITIKLKSSAFMKEPNVFVAGPDLVQGPLFAYHCLKSLVTFCMFLVVNKSHKKTKINNELNLPTGACVAKA